MGMWIAPAYRVREGVDFWLLVAQIQRRARLIIRKRLKAQYVKWLSDQKYRDNIRFIEGLKPDEIVSPWDCSRYFYRQYKEAAAQDGWHPADADASVIFYEEGDRIYLRPIADRRGFCHDLFEFLHKDARFRDMLEEFHYQNKMDAPSYIKNWEERARVWHAITEGEREWERLLLEVCSLGSLFQFDPWTDMRKEWDEVKGLQTEASEEERARW